jgi:hypothetical protein
MTRLQDMAASSEETLRDFLARRERELTHQIAALQGQIAPKELELAEIKQALAALPLNISYSAQVALEAASLDIGGPTYTPSIGPHQLPLGLQFGTMTIKELVLQALSDQFPDGATAAQIREFVRDAYGRAIDQNSLRPQLARMKDEGMLENLPGLLNQGKWKLALRGVTADDLIAIGHWPKGAKHKPQETNEAPTEQRSEGASRATDGAGSPIKRRF